MIIIKVSGQIIIYFFKICPWIFLKTQKMYRLTTTHIKESRRRSNNSNRRTVGRPKLMKKSQKVKNCLHNKLSKNYRHPSKRFAPRFSLHWHAAWTVIQQMFKHAYTASSYSANVDFVLSSKIYKYRYR